MNKPPRQARIGIRLVVFGLALQLGLAFYWTPGTFVLSAAVAMPLVLLGCGLLALAAWHAAKNLENEGPSK
jgi:hypothetical protein